MEIQNSTNEPIEYDQEGSPPLPEEGEGRGRSSAGECSGRLDPNQGTGSFEPCENAPWTVTLTMAATGCNPPWIQVGGIDNANVTLTAEGTCSQWWVKVS